MCVFLVNSNEHLRVIRNRSMCGRKEGSESGKWEVGSGKSGRLELYTRFHLQFAQAQNEGVVCNLTPDLACHVYFTCQFRPRHEAASARASLHTNGPFARERNGNDQQKHKAKLDTALS